MKTTLEQVPFGGWPNALRLTDGRTELIVTTDIGPRIIRCGRVGGPNLFHTFTKQLGRSGQKLWKNFGGHRFWVAPEERALTYVPDNQPVAWSWNGQELRVRPKTDRPSGLQKEMIISLQRDAVRVRHTLTQQGRRTLRVAPWSLSVMAAGGVALLPQEAYGSHTKHLLPARPLVLWKYTNMADARWTWGRQLIRLRQDIHDSNPQKAGFRSTPGWMAYALPHATFIKRHHFNALADYPDMGCNAEVFTNENFLELESLGGLVDLKPGARTTHVETWHIGPPVNLKADDATLLKALRPLVAATPRPI